MKIRNFVGIALLLILSLIYTWYEANRPQPVDWSETYSPKDKIPYGTYITYRSLPELFPASKIRTSRLSIAEEFGSGRDTSAGTYIFVGLDYRIDALELKHLMQWVEKGNDMFVAAGWIADTLLNALSLKLEQNLNPSGSKLLFAPGHVYPFYKIRHGSYFVLPADFKGERLGDRIDNDSTDFIRLPYGRGQVFLNLNPWAFTNRWVLDSVCGDYYYKALSWLPDKGRTVIWDAYRTLGRQEAQTPLRVILQYPALKWALYLLLAGDYESKDIIPLMVEMYEFIRDFKGEVPGAAPKDCGNYLDMNLGMANYLAKRYLDNVLYDIKPDRLVYPE